MCRIDQVLGWAVVYIEGKEGCKSDGSKVSNVMMRDTKCKPEPSTIADDLPVDAYKGMPMGKGLA